MNERNVTALPACCHATVHTRAFPCFHSGNETVSLDRMEALLAALADARRQAIIEVLLRETSLAGRASQSDLRRALDIPDSRKGTLKKDVDVLEQCGVVVGCRTEYVV